MIDKPTFKGQLSVVTIGLIDRVLDGKGRDVMTLPGGPQRLADCANALKDIWFPLAHVPAMENRIERLEQLRKEAVARLGEEDQNTDTPETAKPASHGTASDAMDPSTGRVSPSARTHHSGGGSANTGECHVNPVELPTYVNGPNEGKTSLAAREGEEAAAPNPIATPALLRPEPAGEAAAFPWRFDMENAPRGSFTTTTRQGKEGPREVKTPKREVIFVAGEDGHVTQSYWVPDAERWCMFTKDRPPIAWMALPTFPVEALRRVAA